MADEFRIYGRAECLPVERARWEGWADACEAAIATISAAENYLRCGNLPPNTKATNSGA